MTYIDYIANFLDATELLSIHPTEIALYFYLLESLTSVSNGYVHLYQPKGRE